MDKLNTLRSLAKFMDNTVLLWAVEEIARLREERMTNEERGAISWATAALLHDADKTWPAFRERSKHSREAAKTLNGLLERLPLPPEPETKEVEA